MVGIEIKKEYSKGRSFWISIPAIEYSFLVI